ncbi:SpoIID/LytB domain-containing protein [Deferribacter abyssi]|uniref:SpoIID/LytB domain-containing protein n=1 Tax=Deferribacter abyssi TaxID=213806 RepID=UPI003C228BF3
MYKFLISLLFFCSVVYADNLAANSNSEVLDILFARQSIAEGKYYIEVGKYLDALEYFETALESTNNKYIVADALLQKATLFAHYLDKPEEAAKIYEKLFKEYPDLPQGETALYKLALLYNDFQDEKKALDYFKLYLKYYPMGRFRFTASFFIERFTKKQLYTPKQKFLLPPITIKNAPNIRVRLYKGKSAKLKGNVILKDNVGRILYQYNGVINIAVKGQTLMVNLRPINTRTLFIYSNNNFLFLYKKNNFNKYRGYFKVFIKKGNLYVINILNIEDYLKSVVTSESPSSWPLETLKAQAVAARTYALYQKLHREDWSYDVVDNEGDQAYKGVKNETSKGIKSVVETTGLVLTYRDRPILSFFTASTGWYIDDPKYIFGSGYPYLRAKPDPYSAKEKMGKWVKKATLSQIEIYLKKKGVNIGTIYSIQPYKVTPAGRVIKVKIIHSRGSKVLRTYTTVRRAVGLYDILFKISQQGNNITFTGGGFGHGIGYSQWGGKALGDMGKRFDEILKFYYEGAVLKKMW